jgi:DNA excision repair protein ERCC-8
MSLASHLAARESGGAPAARFAACVHASRRAALAPSAELRFERGAPRGAGVLCLELDTSPERRLLLAGAADGSVSLYDTAPRPHDAATQPQQPQAPAPPVLRLPRGVAHAHGCAAGAWYPSGGGLFFTAGLDGVVKGWDACAGAEALRFGAGGGGTGGTKLYALALPASACAPHGLLAAGASDGRVLLFDPAAGGGAHALAGHRAAVLCAAWLPGAEHVLATGGADGAVRLWDVRTAGTLLLLDAHRTAGEHEAGEGGEGGAASSSSHLLHSPQPQQALTVSASAGAATAHTGAVTALAATPDGRTLLSHGCDGRLRAWCAARALNLLVHYPAAATPNASRLGTRLGVSADGRVVYVPCRTAAAPLRVSDGGAPAPPLAGAHFGNVVAVVPHPHSDEVFTAAGDGTVVAWAPRRRRSAEEEAGEEARAAAREARRRNGAWSDDDETEAARGPRMAYRALPPPPPPWRQ